MHYVCEEVFVKRGEYYMCLKKFAACEVCVLCVCKEVCGR